MPPYWRYRGHFRFRRSIAFAAMMPLRHFYAAMPAALLADDADRHLMNRITTRYRQFRCCHATVTLCRRFISFAATPRYAMFLIFRRRCLRVAACCRSPCLFPLFRQALHAIFAAMPLSFAIYGRCCQRALCRCATDDIFTALLPLPLPYAALSADIYDDAGATITREIR